MIVSALIGIALVLISVVGHYEALRGTAKGLAGSGLKGRRRVIAAMAAILAAHLLSTILFAFAYARLQAWGFGELSGETTGHWADFFYFSLMSFTTLGVGDIFALGPLRIVSGLQALHGFVLIAWSASFAFAVMRNIWED